MCPKDNMPSRVSQELLGLPGGEGGRAQQPSMLSARRLGRKEPLGSSGLDTTRVCRSSTKTSGITGTGQPINRFLQGGS